MTEQITLFLFSFLKTTSFVIGITLFVRGVIPPLYFFMDKKSDPKKFVSLYNFNHLNNVGKLKVVLMLIGGMLLCSLSFIFKNLSL